MIADLILIGIIALCIFLGYTRGLIKVAVRIIGFFSALIIALILYTPVSNYIINNTDVVANIEQTIEKKIYDKEENEEKPKDLMGTIEDYTNGIKEESSKYIAKNIAVSMVRVRNMARLILSCKSTNDICKDICKHNRKNTNNKTIQQSTEERYMVY